MVLIFQQFLCILSAMEDHMLIFYPIDRIIFPKHWQCLLCSFLFILQQHKDDFLSDGHLFKELDFAFSV